MTTTVAVGPLVPWIAGALAMGGVAAAASRRRQLMLRWCLWAVAVPAVVALFWWGHPGTAALAVVAASISGLELGALLGLRRADRAALAASLVAVVLTTWLAVDHLPRILGLCLLAVAVVPLVSGDAEHGLLRASRGVLALVWLSPLAAVVPLGGTALVVFLAVSLADVVAYVAGPAIGGPRLSPLSPAKRWSGTLCGAAAGVGLLAVLGALTWPMAVAVAVGGPAGDLLESMVKRGAGVKDSGNWMAGAGGLLDRIDSLLLALAVLLVLS